MERSEVEKPPSEDGSHLNRNRSFKSKQLVRSQAIRESQSPPRTISPSPYPDNENGNVADENNVANNATPNNITKNTVVTNNVTNDNVVKVAVKNNVANNVVKNVVKNNVTVNDSSDRTLCDDDDRCSDVCIDVIGCDDGKDSGDDKKQQVEIQITSGSWDEVRSQRLRARRWLGAAQRSEPSGLLTHGPRVACVCGACAHCPHCRGRRRRHACPIKQDSGIACSDDCPDCSDSETTGGNESSPKSESVDEEQTYYCRCPERKEKPKTIIPLSRTDSDERAEPSGPELVSFLKETLNKNARDRLTLLKIEKELHALVSDTGRCIVRFPVMTSYGRMLVHRCAALFQLSHHLDHANKTCVLVSKNGTSGGRIPCTGFKAWCTATFPPSPQRQAPDVTHAKSILKRDTQSLDEASSGSLASSRSKSLEQREKDYERMKRRIFSTDNCSTDESQWPWLGAPVKLRTPHNGRSKLLKVQSLEASGPAAPPGRGRGAVSKSHSFGGYAGADPPPPRLLSRQGDLASSSWRLSPSSSGYKTLSLRSTDSVTPSPTGGASPEPCAIPPSQCETTEAEVEVEAGVGVEVEAEAAGAIGPGGAVVWCVTDMACVPPGALLIHPQTGRPLSNPDGSVYRFDPANPPAIYDASYPQDNKIDQNEKKRGKLEKQHSFIDHGGTECECPAEETRNKCCCECPRHEATHVTRTEAVEKIQNTPEQKPQIPSSPSKPRYEETNHTAEVKPRPVEPANQKAPEQRPNYEPANQRPAYTAPANDVPYNNYGYANERPQYESHTRTSSYEQTNQRTSSYEQANQRPPSYEPANQRPPSYEPANQRPPSYEPANQRPPSYEPVNQRPPSYDPANQRPPSYEPANQRERVNKLTNQESQENLYSQHGHVMRNDEQVGSPPQLQSQVYVGSTPGALVPGKATPGSLPEHNIRPMSLTNMVYPTAIPQAYPYINQCRMDQPLQPIYQQLAVPEDQKQLAPSPHEPTFRIDPSYPYAAVDYSGQCGSCVDPNTMRSYNISYGQMELPQGALPPAYPGGNVLLPQTHIQHYPYQEPVQCIGGYGAGGKLLLPEYPVYPALCAQYPLLYPQVIPQPYPVCQPVYQGAPEPPRAPERRDQREHDKNTSRRNSTEIAAKIQQIKEQMAALNTRPRRREEWRRRPGAGLLGAPPRPHLHHNAGSNDETQLSSAARAIVNSIRNMQAKNTYQDHRRDYNNHHHHNNNNSNHYNNNSNHYNNNNYNNNRSEYRPRRSRTPDRDKTGEESQSQYRQAYLLRQMTPGTWCRRSPAPVHPALNQPRRPHPDTRNGRR